MPTGFERCTIIMPAGYILLQEQDQKCLLALKSSTIIIITMPPGYILLQEQDQKCLLALKALAISNVH